jgi:hypothetical protein
MSNKSVEAPKQRLTPEEIKRETRREIARLKEAIIDKNVVFTYSQWLSKKISTNATAEQRKSFVAQRQHFEDICRTAFGLAERTPIDQEAINKELQRRVEETLEHTRDIHTTDELSARSEKILKDIDKKFRKDMNRMWNGEQPLWGR